MPRPFTAYATSTGRLGDWWGRSGDGGGHPVAGCTAPTRSEGAGSARPPRSAPVGRTVSLVTFELKATAAEGLGRATDGPSLERSQYVEVDGEFATCVPKDGSLCGHPDTGAADQGGCERFGGQVVYAPAQPKGAHHGDEQSGARHDDLGGKVVEHDMQVVLGGCRQVGHHPRE